MFKEKNTLVMQLSDLSLGIWLLLLYPASTAETGLLRWRPHMHWADKLAWYVLMALGPVLAGFMVGVAFGGRKVYRNCKSCGGKFDVDTMYWSFEDATGGVGSWRCQKCREQRNSTSPGGKATHLMTSK